MQILSYRDIDNIALVALKKYRKSVGDYEKINIMDFAEGYLNLTVSEACLSDNETILGITTFTDTPCEVWNDGKREIVWIPSNNIIVDKSLSLSGNYTRKRFTIAHECAHQFLHCRDFSVGPLNRKTVCRLCDGTNKSKLTTAGEWLEWQANVFAAALLIPRDTLHSIFKEYTGQEKFRAVYGTLLPEENKKINDIADYFGVSFSTMVIRLEKLGYVVGWYTHDIRSSLNIYCDSKEMYIV